MWYTQHSTEHNTGDCYKEEVVTEPMVNEHHILGKCEYMVRLTVVFSEGTRSAKERAAV